MAAAYNPERIIRVSNIVQSSPVPITMNMINDNCDVSDKQHRKILDGARETSQSVALAVLGRW